MARPRHERPTPAELEILKILWARGPLTVRETIESLPDERAGIDGAPRAYTSVMSLMNVMADKGHLTRKLDGRAYRYYPADEPADVRGDFLRDVWNRVFGRSTASLALHLLDVSSPTEQELDAIRAAIETYRTNKLGETDGASERTSTASPSKRRR